MRTPAMRRASTSCRASWVRNWARRGARRCQTTSSGSIPWTSARASFPLCACPRQAEIIPLGIVLYTYLRLKLHLRIAGFSPVCHDYDWRLGVDELGRDLAKRLAADPSPRLMVVAHSLGGLVARAAMALPGASRIERVVLMGTPNAGSFAPVQALRGVYAVVRKIARLAQHPHRGASGRGYLQQLSQPLSPAAHWQHHPRHGFFRSGILARFRPRARSANAGHSAPARDANWRRLMRASR